MAKGNSRDPHRFAGKMGIESGPIPLRRWKGDATATASERRAPDVRITNKQMRSESKAKGR